MSWDLASKPYVNSIPFQIFSFFFFLERRKGMQLAGRHHWLLGILPFIRWVCPSFFGWTWIIIRLVLTKGIVWYLSTACRILPHKYFYQIILGRCVIDWSSSLLSNEYCCTFDAKLNKKTNSHSSSPIFL